MSAAHKTVTLAKTTRFYKIRRFTTLISGECRDKVGLGCGDSFGGVLWDSIFECVGSLW